MKQIELMKVIESIWYEARSLDGVYRPIFDGDYFKTCGSIEETRNALDRHIQKFHKDNEVYLICKITHRTTHDETGAMVKDEEIIETVERYPAA